MTKHFTFKVCRNFSLDTNNKYEPAMIVRMGFLIICLPIHCSSDCPVSGWMWHRLVVFVLFVKYGTATVSAMGAVTEESAALHCGG